MINNKQPDLFPAKSYRNFTVKNVTVPEDTGPYEDDDILVSSV